MFAASSGARKVASQSRASTNAKEIVTPTASRRAAWRGPSPEPMASAAASLDIGQQRDEQHPYIADRIHESVVAWIDHDVGLGAETDRPPSPFTLPSHQH